MSWPVRPAPRLWTRLPEALHHRGAPSPWAAMTRPGQPLHSFLEAPFFDAKGDLWLSDVASGRILRVTPGGDWSVEHAYEGAPHAMRPRADGTPLVADYYRGLGRLEGGGFVPVSTGLPDRPFLGLSDMAPAPDGAIWITDSGRSSLSDPTGRLWRYAPGGALRLVLSNVPYANGVALSPDGAWVYLAATRANQVWRLAAALPAQGPPMAGVFLHLSGGLGPDGLATNPLGWLAVAQAQAGRAYVVDALGDAVAEVRLPDGRWTTSVAFHPDDPHRLVIVEAERGALFIADLPQQKDIL
ncbi:SMP-30/gluconolactonase/LRE family protein [Rhodobacteraceae bacterium CCMM004]|nr:SMP-30/gluconolactonase/LRE family protein [Rhodobacteraceae bacterium CCMM004]